MKNQTKKNTKHTKRSFYHFSLSQYIAFHYQALEFSITKMRQTLTETWMTAAVIGIALALPAIFFVLLHNINIVANHLETGTQISLFLDQHADLKALTAHIEARPDVANVHYISPEEGLKELETQEGLSDVLAQLPENPLPSVMEVSPATQITTPEQVQHLLDALKIMPGVDSVKLDMLWVKRLHAILTFCQCLVIGLSLLLAFAVIFVINHTIRLSTQNRQKEINVLMMIGATRGFVRRPFLYTGILYGGMGSVLAWIFVETCICGLSFPAAHLADLYHTSITLQGLDFFASIDVIVLGLLLGWIGSWSAVSHCITQDYSNPQ